MDVLPVKDVRGMDGYEAVVLGTALYVGRWHGQMRDFLRRRRSELMDKPVALFVLGPVKDPHDDVEWENARKQTASELEGFPWLEPVSRALFGGRFDPSRLPFPLDRLARDAASDATDRPAVRAWAIELADRLLPVGVAR